MEFTLYLDESGDKGLTFIDPNHPVLSVVGCIVERHYYQSVICNTINSFKKKYWGNTDVILHSENIRRKEGDFTFLSKDSARAHEFYSDINIIMSTLEYVLIAIVIDKNGLASRYKKPLCPYELSLTFIMERYCHFLQNNRGRIKAESRGKAEDAKLYKTYLRVINGSTNYVNDFSNITGMTWEQKSKNSIGLQLADLIAYPVARRAIDPLKPYTPFGVIEPKFRKDSSGSYDGCGLKLFPDDGRFICI